MTKCGRWLWLPSHRTVPSFRCKDIQLLITGRRGAEGEVEHSQGLFYRKAWTMMPGVTKAGRNPYREAGTCDKCHGTLEHLLQLKRIPLEAPGLAVYFQLHAAPNSWETTTVSHLFRSFNSPGLSLCFSAFCSFFM